MNGESTSVTGIDEESEKGRDGYGDEEDGDVVRGMEVKKEYSEEDEKEEEGADDSDDEYRSTGEDDESNTDGESV